MWKWLMKKQVTLFFHLATSISFPCVKHGKPRTRAGHFERTDGGKHKESSVYSVPLANPPEADEAGGEDLVVYR
jgi:hypothetical protein